MNLSYILVLIGALLCSVAAGRVKSVYRKYSTVRATCGMTGAQVARKILNDNGIYDVDVNEISGELTDHYNPSGKAVNLSRKVYCEPSISSIAVAAHECGHVLQYYKGYSFMKFRTFILPIANFGSKIGLPMVVIGLILSGAYRYSYQASNIYMLANLGIIISKIGIWLFAFVVLFQLITLPVELNASNRALKILENSGILISDEVPYGKKVLKAAAMTYVASAASSVLQLLRFLPILTGGKRK